MDTINKQKSENRLSDIKQGKIYSEKLKAERTYFVYADTTLSLLEAQKEEDLIILQESFMKWITVIPQEDKRKDELTLLLKSIWRLQSYCGALETVCKSSTVSVHQAGVKIANLESEKRAMELQNALSNSKYEQKITQLEREIEFFTKNG